MLNLIISSQSAAEIAVWIFAFLVIILVSFPLHAYVQGMTAKALGDLTAEESGRLTLNPIYHIDIMGALAMLLFGIGWSKSVPIDPSRCTKVKPKTAMALISAAGILENLLFAYIGMIIYKIILYSNAEMIAAGTSSVPYYLLTAMSTIITINIYLTIFNLLPIPPFDGSRVFLIFLPTKLYFKIMKYERVIMGIVIVLLLLGVFSIPLQFLTNLITNGMFYATGYVEFFFGI